MRIKALWNRLFRTGAKPQPGLYVYQVCCSQTAPGLFLGKQEVDEFSRESSGGQGRGGRRLHLRVQPDGSGLLFVDLADPVHLNPMATTLVWHALEGRSAEEAFCQLRRSADKAGWPVLRQTVEAVFGWVARLKSGSACCAWEALTEAGAFGPESVSLAALAPAPSRQNHLLNSSPIAWAEPRPVFSLPVQAPYKADVVLQYNCNNQCGHCYNPPERRRLPPMSMQTWQEAAQKLAELGVPQVILTGGEPTLCDDLPERIRVARQYGLAVGLNTNGRRLADPAFTARLAQAGLDHVQITLLSSRPEVHNRLSEAGAGLSDRPADLAAPRFPSGRPEACNRLWQIARKSDRPPKASAYPLAPTGQERKHPLWPNGDGQQRLWGDPFDQTLRGIQNALASGLYILTNTTLTKHNAHEAESLVEFLYHLGIRTFAMNGIIRSGLGKQFPDALAEEELGPVLVRVRDRAAELGMRFLWYTPTRYCRFSPLELELGVRRCNAGQYSICIEPNGDVLPCQSYYQPVGNLLRDPWPAIWESPLFRRLRGRCEDPAGAGLPTPCWHCPDLPVCGGGCMLSVSDL